MLYTGSRQGVWGSLPPREELPAPCTKQQNKPITQTKQKTMKKTLIALMALAGVASAAISKNDMNRYVDEVIAESGYTAGDSFALTLNFDGRNGYDNKFMSLSDEYFIFNNANNYYAFSNSADGANIVWPGASDTVGDNGNKTVTMTVAFADTTSALNANNYWFTYSGFNNSGEPAKSGIQLRKGDSVQVAYADGTTTLTITKTGVVTNILNIEGYTLNATDINLLNDASYTGAVFTTGGTTYNIPEPATATLSLLALAGLAARRRRH